MRVDLSTVIAVCGLLSFSCTPKEKTEKKPTPVAPKPVETKPTEPVASKPAETKPAQTSPTGAASTAPTTAPTGAWFEPPIPPFEMGMMDHLSRFGWSKDGAEIAYCVPNGGVEGETCTFEKLDRSKEQINTFDEQKGELSSSKEKAVKARFDQMGYGPTTTTLPAGFVVFWKATLGDASKEHPKATMEVGIRAVATKKEGTPINIEVEDTVEIHPEMIALSPDGKHFAIIVHTFFGEYSDGFTTSIMPVESMLNHVR